MSSLGFLGCLSFVRALTNGFWLLVVCLCLSNIAAAQNALKPAQLALVPCEIAGVKGKVSYEVFENRAHVRESSAMRVASGIITLIVFALCFLPFPFTI